MCSVLDNNIVSMFNFLIFIIVLWLCKKIHLSVQMQAEIFRNKGDVSTLPSNHSSNIHVYVFVYPFRHTYRETRDIEKQRYRMRDREGKQM